MNASLPPGPARRWSWSIGRLAGIDVRVHATFLLLLAWIVLSGLGAGQGARAVLEGVGTLAIVFGVVVLHELGHALVARRFGIRTRDITLLPIGGVARLERMPTDPREELLVAVAGPAVNLVLAVAAVGVLVTSGALGAPHGVAVIGGPLLLRFIWLNVGLAAFNLLPAFPMDGGRVLRAVLAMGRGRVRATDVSVRVGQWLAAALGLAGLLGSPVLVFVALFVWVGAVEERALVHVGAALDAVRVGDAMVTSFESMPAAASVAEAIERAVHTNQREFPVIDHDRLVGFVSVRDLLRTSYEGASGAPVASIATPTTEPVDPHELVEPVVERLEQTGGRVLAVVDEGRLVGLLLPENVLQLAEARDRWLADAPADRRAVQRGDTVLGHDEVDVVARRGDPRARLEIEHDA